MRKAVILDAPVDADTYSGPPATLLPGTYVLGDTITNEVFEEWRNVIGPDSCLCVYTGDLSGPSPVGRALAEGRPVAQEGHYVAHTGDHDGDPSLAGAARTGWKDASDGLRLVRYIHEEEERPHRAYDGASIFSSEDGSLVLRTVCGGHVAEQSYERPPTVWELLLRR